MIKRKSPIRHKVRTHVRKGATVEQYNRGRGRGGSKRIVKKKFQIDKDKITEKFYQETKAEYPLAKKSDEWELYDDKAGGMVINTETMQGWCIGEEGIDEKRLPPPVAWYKLGLSFKRILGVTTITWK